jgi:tRNA pseudouridine38-40 synthase
LRVDHVDRPKAKVVLRLSYDGRLFSGSQRQAGRRTVQGELERAIEVLAGRPVAAVFAGRTDAGVHAAGQVVSLDDPRPELSDERLVRALNDGLPDDVAVQSVSRCTGDFHARYDAKWREYRYRLWVGERQPLVCGIVSQRTRPIDPDRLTAIERLIGTHDFASFAGSGDGVPWSERRNEPRGTTRTVLHASVKTIAPWWGAAPETGSLIEIAIRADGFLAKMVRNIVGALTEVGEGRREPEWLDELLAAADRRVGPKTASPEGLTLWRVGYQNEAAAERS